MLYIAYHKTKMVKKNNGKKMIDDKKDRIIAAANQMFAHFGIQKTTMNEIAKKSRMSKSTMYYYFNSKEEIFAEVIRRDSVVFKLELNQAIAKGKTPQKKIGNYVLARMEHLKILSNYYTTLTDDYIEHYAFVENARKDFIDYEINTLSLLLEEGVNLGLFAINSVETTARNFSIWLKGLEYSFVTKDNKNNIKEESNQILTILFKGIEAR